MRKYPKLKSEVQCLIHTQLRQDERKTKEQLDQLVKIELSYMNTNHEDFIGFAAAQSNAEMASRQKITNQVIRKGYLITKENQGLMYNNTKGYWFVLTSSDLSWFKDDEEKDKRFMLSLDELMIREVKSGFMSKKHSFALFNTHNKNVYRDLKQLELACETKEELENWKASFLRAGVYCEKEPITNGDDLQDDQEYAAADPHLDREVETIRNLVKSYVKIVSKTFRDLVPKYITRLVINEMKEFIVGDTLYILLNDLYSNGEHSTLMEMSPEEEKRKDDILKLYNSISDALKKINDISMKTPYTEIPPPVKTNDFEARKEFRNGHIPNGHHKPLTLNGHTTAPSNYRSNNENILKPIPAPQLNRPTNPLPPTNKPIIPSRVLPYANGNVQNIQNKLQPPLVPSRPAPAGPRR